jgi:hypothetical protein
MRSTKLTARTTGLARAEQAWSWDSYALFAVGLGVSHSVPTQDRVENPGTRAPFQ